MSFGNIFVLGDSYSTFEGCMVCKEAGCHYTSEGMRKVDGMSVEEKEDVCKVEQTWWDLLAAETNSTIIANNSWGGSTICNTGYGGGDFTWFSFTTRLNKMIEDGFFEKNKIDTIFVFGGTNDSWANAPLGELQFSDWQVDDLYMAMPAFCYLLDMIKTKLPDTKPIVLINTDLQPVFEEKYIEGCEKYGVEYVKFDYVHKWDGHPTLTGMRQIKDKILELL